mmetsp:Transcript_14358/g.21286  ORF Transcript_14358/g.21286 Transcript_14358/m.21286 type:complete len:797 (+) Transcript_14358:35-2425(+)
MFSSTVDCDFKSKPKISSDEALKLLKDRWGIEGHSLVALESLANSHFKVTSVSNEMYNLRVFNGMILKSENIFAARLNMVSHLAENCNAYHFPEPLLSKNGSLYEKIELPVKSGERINLPVCVTKWVNGSSLNTVQNHGIELWEEIGSMIATVNQTMNKRNSSEPVEQNSDNSELQDSDSYEKNLEIIGSLKWDNCQENHRKMLAEISAEIRTKILPIRSSLQRAKVHCNVKPENVIVNGQNGTLKGLVGFERLRSCFLVSEVASAMAFSMLSKNSARNDILGVSGAVLLGFISCSKLHPIETTLLRTIVAFFLCSEAAEETLAHSYHSERSKNLFWAADQLWNVISDVHTRALWEKAAMGVPLPVLLSVSKPNTFKRKFASNSVAAFEAPKKLIFVPSKMNEFYKQKTIIEEALSCEQRFAVTTLEIALPELQGDAEDIARKKCKICVESVYGPIIVEEFSLAFEALGGLPGPYVGHFIRKIGAKGLCDLLDGFENKNAKIVTTFAYCEGPRKIVEIFTGEMEGEIIPTSGEKKGEDWGSVFKPNGSNFAYNEMKADDLLKICQRLRAANGFKKCVFGYGEKNSEEIQQPKNVKMDSSEENLQLNKNEGRKNLIFVTGNVNKLKEVKKIMGNELKYNLTNCKLDLPEFQGEAEEIVRQKCLTATERINGTVIVEDTSLGFSALNDLPGPYIKWFLDKIGHEGLNKILSAFEDKSAEAKCLFALCEGRGEPVYIFEGNCQGKIVLPRGPGEFGWDPVFEPKEGKGKTFAEMGKEEKNAISHRFKALQKLKEFLNKS